MALRERLETIRLCEEHSEITNNDIDLLVENDIEIKEYLIKIKGIADCGLRGLNGKIIHNLCKILSNTYERDKKEIVIEYAKHLEGYSKLFKIKDFEELVNNCYNILLECGDNFEALKVYKVSDTEDFYINDRRESMSPIYIENRLKLATSKGFCDGIFIKDNKMELAEDKLEMLERVLDRKSYDYALVIDDLDTLESDIRKLGNLDNRDTVWICGLLNESSIPMIYRELRKEYLKKWCYIEKCGEVSGILDLYLSIRRLDNYSIDKAMEFILDTIKGFEAWNVDKIEEKIKEIVIQFRRIDVFKQKFETTHSLSKLGIKFMIKDYEYHKYIKELKTIISRDKNEKADWEL